MCIEEWMRFVHIADDKMHQAAMIQAICAMIEAIEFRPFWLQVQAEVDLAQEGIVQAEVDMAPGGIDQRTPVTNVGKQVTGRVIVPADK